MSDRHRTVLVYRVGRGWWARCQVCPWESEPDPASIGDHAGQARAAGRAHEAVPVVDWSVLESWLTS